MKSLFISLALVLSAATAVACFAPNPDQTSTPEELVKRTKQIYLAIALKQDQKGPVQLSVVETLKGPKKSKIQIQGLLSEFTGNDFAAHSQPEFWETNGGRMLVEPSCQINPAFSKDKKYLVFVDKPYHVKSFELIEDVEKDAWLKKIRSILKL